MWIVMFNFGNFFLDMSNQKNSNLDTEESEDDSDWYSLRPVTLEDFSDLATPLPLYTEPVLGAKVTGETLGETSEPGKISVLSYLIFI